MVNVGNPCVVIVMNIDLSFAGDEKVSADSNAIKTLFSSSTL